MLDALPDDADGGTTTGSREIRGGPEHTLPRPLLDIGPLQTQEPAGDSFEAVHENRDGRLGRIGETLSEFLIASRSIAAIRPEPLAFALLR